MYCILLGFLSPSFWISVMLSVLFLAFSDLSLNVPNSLLQILNRVILQISTPDVFNRVAEIKAHVLRDLNALDACAAIAFSWM
jgi:hypothetical protein